jgi:hypothetical protein
MGIPVVRPESLKGACQHIVVLVILHLDNYSENGTSQLTKKVSKGGGMQGGTLCKAKGPKGYGSERQGLSLERSRPVALCGSEWRGWTVPQFKRICSISIYIYIYI